jgi:hypothetical protein
MARCGFLGDYLPLWCCHACDLRSDERRCADRRPRNDPQTLKSIHIGMYPSLANQYSGVYVRRMRGNVGVVSNGGPRSSSAISKARARKKFELQSAPSRLLSHQTAITTLHSKCRSKRPHQVAASHLHPFLSPTPRACSKPTSQTQSRIHTYTPMR